MWVVKIKTIGMGIVAACALLAGCGEPGKDDRASYEVCLLDAKKDPRLGKAEFANYENSKVAGSTGDAGMRVNIPYELDGKKGLFQCVAEKQQDGTFKVTN